jgi:hypothetical protein
MACTVLKKRARDQQEATTVSRSPAPKAAPLALIVLIWASVACGSASSASHARQVHLRLVSERQLRAMCLSLIPVPQDHYVSRARAVQAVRHIPQLKLYQPHLPVEQAVLAWVKAKDRPLVANRHAKWVVVVHYPHISPALFFVDAMTGRPVYRMVVGDGCHQASGIGQVHLRLVTPKQLYAICVKLLPPPPGRYLPRWMAIRAVESVPSVKQHGGVPINEAVLARVHSEQPGLGNYRHVMWVLVSVVGPAPNDKNLWFIDAQSGRNVVFVGLGDGCLQ